MKNINYRRYYLHRKLKGCVKVNARRRIISAPYETFNSLPENVAKIVFELRNSFRYSIQYSL